MPASLTRQPLEQRHGGGRGALLGPVDEVDTSGAIISRCRKASVASTREIAAALKRSESSVLVTLEAFDDPPHVRFRPEPSPTVPPEVLADRARRAALPVTVNTLILGDPEPSRFAQRKI
jgi:hypothetical protein